MPYKVKQSSDGFWVVVGPCGSEVSRHQSNSKAWKALDALTYEAASPRDVKKNFTVAADSEEMKQKWYSALLKLADDKGRKQGWAAYVFKDKLGHWPDDMERKTGPVFPAVALFLRDRSKQNAQF